MTMPNRSGVYVITNTVNGKRYVGSSRSLSGRQREHLSFLRKGDASQKLQQAWDKHGPDAFVFRPLVFCAREHLTLYEQLFLDAFKTASRGYNVASVAQSNIGIKHTEESKANFRAGAKGRKMPPMSNEARMAHSLSALSRNQRPPMSPEIAEKIRIALTGVKRPPLSREHRAKLSAAKLGGKLSARHRRNISKSVKRFWENSR